MKLLRSQVRRVNWLQPAARRPGSEAISSLPRYLQMPNEADVFLAALAGVSIYMAGPRRALPVRTASKELCSLIAISLSVAWTEAPLSAARVGNPSGYPTRAR